MPLVSIHGTTITPTWVDLEDGRILVNTAEGRLKQKNISRDDRIAISVVDQNNPYQMVTIRGRVVEQTKEGADEHIDKLAKKYLGVVVRILRNILYVQLLKRGLY